MLNVKFNHKTLFKFDCIQAKIKEKRTNKTKLLLEVIKVFKLPVGRLSSKSCQFHAAHASFILIMLFSSLGGDIGEVSKIFNF